ncbi:YveK family protein [Anaerococcus rubeinfantis]|uniref:YveK family protein n=1 Tax=Anaerococcus rubeinfantis TaxID=1720199 RepID=UPI00073E2E81|nr:Wzz/FepE/Etk N-terminal domain-containing protein [Anaerococcus rubeinfantis]
MYENEIDILKVLKNVIKNIGKIITVSLIFGIVFFILSKFIISPSYEADTTIMVSKNTDSSTISTYAKLTKSNEFSKEIIKKLDLDMTSEELANKILVEPDSGSSLINIKVTDSIPKRAADIANQTAVELTNSIGKLSNKKVLISDKAKSPKKPISPNVKKYTALGLFLGFFVGIIYVLVNDFRDTRIKSAEEIENYYEIPIIGVIPKEEKGE